MGEVDMNMIAHQELVNSNSLRQKLRFKNICDGTVIGIFVGYKAKGRVSKRRQQESKGAKFSENEHFLPPDMRT